MIYLEKQKGKKMKIEKRMVQTVAPRIKLLFLSILITKKFSFFFCKVEVYNNSQLSRIFSGLYALKFSFSSILRLPILSKRELCIVECATMKQLQKTLWTRHFPNSCTEKSKMLNKLDGFLSYDKFGVEFFQIFRIALYKFEVLTTYN